MVCTENSIHSVSPLRAKGVERLRNVGVGDTQNFVLLAFDWYTFRCNRLEIKLIPL